jgi:hypothetical protein
MPKLRRLDARGNTVEERALDGAREVTIGRAPDNDIVVSNPDVSRRHARIERDTEGFNIIDAGSSHGVFVNGVKVPRKQLRDSDRIRVGPIEFVFEDDAPPPNVPPPPSVPLPTNAAPPPAQPQAPAKKSTALRTCLLGCVSFIAVAIAIVFAIYIWWAKPEWAMRLRFWKGKPFDAAGELRNISKANDADIDDAQRKLDELDRSIAEALPLQHLRTGSRVAQRVSASSGATLETPEHAILEIPPGALASDATVEMAPLIAPTNAQLAAGNAIASDVYRITVNGAEHTTFQRPVTVTLPANTAVAQTLTAAFWDGNTWQPYSTNVAVEQGRVRFQIDHATDITTIGKKIITGIGGGLSGAGGMIGSGLGTLSGTRSELEPWLGIARMWSGPYQTENFSIRYTAPDSNWFPNDRVLGDAEYPLAAGRKPGAAPLYVVDIGEALELAHKKTTLVGLPPASNRTNERFGVFIEKLGAFGESPLGGPLYIDSRMSGVMQGVDWGEMLLTTATHEYMHVLQDDYYNFAEAARNGAWIETSAQTFADLLRYRAAGSRHPSPYMATQQYIARSPQFPRFTMDGEGRGDKDVAYAWATFFLWMETDGKENGITADVLKRKAQMSNFSSVLSTLSDALRARGTSLDAKFTEFCTAYFHDDATSNTIHSAAWWGGLENQSKIADSTPRSLLFMDNVHYLKHDFDAFDHLTGRYFFGDAERAYFYIPAKVVISAKAKGNGGATLHIYRDGYQNMRPVKFDAAPQQMVVKPGEATEMVLDDFGTTTNRVDVIAVNDSYSRDAADFELRMWLLEPPGDVVFQATGSGSDRKYTITWKDSGLGQQKHGGGSDVPFGGYNIYRRKVGAADWNEKPVNDHPIDATRYEDPIAADVDFEYALTTVDENGRESEKSRVQDDPFAGQWSGPVALKEGHLIDLENVSPEDKADRNSLIAMTEKFEMILRAGIRITFELTRNNDQYDMHLLSIMGKSLGDSKATGHFKRVSEHNLEWVPDSPTDKDKNAPPIYLSLEYPNEIHNKYAADKMTMEWTFTRAKK